MMCPNAGGRLVRSLAILFCCLLASCATPPRDPAAFAGLPTRVELSDTPFFPQEQHQCGPASLATALVAAGYPGDPVRLQPQLYLPAREGSLQAEMLAAARRQGALALPGPNTLRELLAEVNAGRPVIVLQNLGLSWVPRWHYAVVIGHDSEKREILLRSGITRREVLSERTFENTWARSERWSMIVLRPGDLPAVARQADVENALAALEKFARPADMIDHYAAAFRRWPDSLVLGVGNANSLIHAGQLAEAEQALRRSVVAHPESAAALNNLATVLRMQHKLDEALAVAGQAVDIGGPWQAQARATRDEIIAAMREHGAPITLSPAPAGTVAP